MRKKFFVILCVFVAVLGSTGLLYACTDPVVNPVTKITITGKPSGNALAPGASVTLGYAVEPADADAFEVEWTSGTPATATIGNDGKLTAVAAGSSFITVKVKGTDLSDTFALTVKSQTVSVPATEVAISGVPSGVIYAGAGAFTLTAALTPSDSTDELVWTSSNPRVATVDEDGAVTPLITGATAIRAAVLGNTELYDEVAITVFPQSADGVYTETFSSVVIDNSSKGTPNPLGTPSATNIIEATMEGTILDGFATKPGVTFGHTDQNVLTVDYGRNIDWDRAFFGPKLGGIFADDKMYTATFNVTLLAASNIDNIRQTNIGVNLIRKNRIANETEKAYNLYRFNEVGQTIDMVINMNETWEYIAVGSFKLGSTDAPASTYKLAINSITIREFTPVTGFSIATAAQDLKVGGSGVTVVHDWTNKAGAGAASPFKVVYSSSDESLATVNAEGKVTATGNRAHTGPVTITARVDGQSVGTVGGTSSASLNGMTPATANVAFNVVFNDVATIGIVDSLDAPVTGTKEFDIYEKTGDELKINLGYTVSGNPSPYAVTWSSLNTAVATVDEDGVVTVVGKGSTVIKVTVNGQTGQNASFTLSVHDSSDVEIVESIVIKVNGTAVEDSTPVIIRMGATVTLTYEVTYVSGAGAYTVTWESLGTDYINIPSGSVNASSVVLEIDAVNGSVDAVVKISVDNETAAAYVYFTILQPAVTAIEFSDDIDTSVDNEMKRGEEIDFTVIPTPAVCDDFDIEWTYSAADVAEVVESETGYKLIALGDGNITVTATVTGVGVIEFAEAFDVVVSGDIDINNGISTETFLRGSLTTDNGHQVYEGAFFNIGGRQSSGAEVGLTLNEQGLGFTFTGINDSYNRMSFYFHSYDKDSDSNSYIVRIPLKLTGMSAAETIGNMRIVYGYRTKASDLFYNVNSTTTGVDKSCDADAVALLKAALVRFNAVGETAVIEISINSADWNGEVFFGNVGNSAGQTGSASFVIGNVSIIKLVDYTADTSGDVVETFETGSVTSMNYSGGTMGISVTNSDAATIITPSPTAPLNLTNSGKAFEWLTGRVYSSSNSVMTIDASAGFDASKAHHVRIPVVLNAVALQPVVGTAFVKLTIRYLNQATPTPGEVSVTSADVTLKYVGDRAVIEFDIPANASNGKIVIKPQNSTVTNTSDSGKYRILFDNISISEVVTPA